MQLRQEQWQRSRRNRQRVTHAMGSIPEDLEPKRKSIGAVEFRKKGNDGRQLWQ
jgi:hypothetical protein